MKKKILFLILALSLITTNICRAETLKIIALVNGEIISSEDMQNRINAFLLNTNIPYNTQTKNMIAQKVLNGAIDEKIKLQEAAKNGIEIKPEEVKAALRQFNPQLNMYFSGGWATATPNLGYDVSFNPIVGINLNIPIFRWGARLKTNRQQKAYISIQKLQQSYVADNINEELSAALTKLTETEYQVKTAKETMNLANENLDLVSFSYNEGKANMVDVLSAQLSWTQAYTNLINAYLSEKMAVAEYRKVISE